MGLFKSIFKAVFNPSIIGGMTKGPDKPAFDAGLDEATKTRLMNQADAFVDPVTKYTDDPERYYDRPSSNENYGTKKFKLSGMKAADKRQRDVQRIYEEYAAAELAKPATTPAAEAPKPELAAPTLEESKDISRTRLATPNTRADNRMVSGARVLAQLSRRQTGAASNVIGR